MRREQIVIQAVDAEGREAPSLEQFTVRIRHRSVTDALRVRRTADGLGAATFELPADVDDSTPIAVTITGPSGAEILSQDVTVADLRGGGPLSVQVPRLRLPTLRPLDQPQPVRGWVIDESSNRAVGGQLVTIFGEANGVALPILSATTDARGHFSGIAEPGMHARAFARVGGSLARNELELSASGQLESPVVITVDRPELVNESCEALEVPRAPDAEALALGGTYSADPNLGQCVDFRQKPDRSLQEVRFSAAVRLTQPEISSARLSAFVPDGAVATANGRFRLDGSEAIDWESAALRNQAATVAYGHLLHYKQSWHADGFSLGDLLYSVPLAPCQTKRVAVIDWDRAERGAGRDEVALTEELLAEVIRDRDILEATSSILAEAMSGGSNASVSSVGAVAGAFLGPLLVGASGGYSTASSDAWQSSGRRLSADFSNHLRDRTMQAQSIMRRLRSTTVRSFDESERVKASSEVIANHNHCHALTVQYFEVLRHFIVKQALESVEECLFVPMRMLYFPHRHAHVLEPNLDPVNEPLSEAFFRQGLLRLVGHRDALEGALEARGYHEIGAVLDDAEELLRRPTEEPALVDHPIEWITGVMGVEFRVPAPQLESSEQWQETLSRILPDGFLELDDIDDLSKLTDMMELFAVTEEEGGKLLLDVDREHDVRAELYRLYRENRESYKLYHYAVIAPAAVDMMVDGLRLFAVLQGGSRQQLPAQFTLLEPYRRGGTLRVSVTLSAPASATLGGASWADFDHLEIDVDPARRQDVPEGAQAIVRWASFGHRMRGVERRGFVPLARGGGGDLFGSGAITVMAVEPPASARVSADVARKRRVQALLEHLNANISDYHHAMWQAMDAGERYMLLDSIEAPDAQRRSVAQVVRNEPIGIVGNSLVLPVAPGVRLDSELAGEDPLGLLERLERHYQPLVPPAPLRFTTPTRGVFAEAVMGDCNACESKDDSRFWRWEESPCPDQPAEIEPLSTASRRSEPLDTSPAPLPSPSIQIQNAPPAPNPTSVAAALEALGRADTFGDATGGAGTLASARAGFDAALSAAQSMASSASRLALARHATAQLNKLTAAGDKAAGSPEGAAENRKKVLAAASGRSYADAFDELNRTLMDETTMALENGAGGSVEAYFPDGSRTRFEIAKEGFQLASNDGADAGQSETEGDSSDGGGGDSAGGGQTDTADETPSDQEPESWLWTVLQEPHPQPIIGPEEGKGRIFAAKLVENWRQGLEQAVPDDHDAALAAAYDAAVDLYSDEGYFDHVAGKAPVAADLPGTDPRGLETPGRVIFSPDALRARQRWWFVQLRDLALYQPDYFLRWVSGDALPIDLAVYEAWSQLRCLMAHAKSDKIKLGGVPTRVPDRLGDGWFALGPHSTASGSLRILSTDGTVVSGYRSFVHQQGTFGKKPTETVDEVKERLEVSAFPGTSRHHWGTDFDLQDTEKLDNKAWPDGSAHYSWLLRHALAYGFIQPMTTATTLTDPRRAYAEERWHWSYWPVSAAILEVLLADASLFENLCRRLHRTWDAEIAANGDDVTYIKKHWRNFMLRVRSLDAAVPAPIPENAGC